MRKKPQMLIYRLRNKEAIQSDRKQYFCHIFMNMSLDICH